jgi:Fe(3+) dicitrate transport protein
MNVNSGVKARTDNLSPEAFLTHHSFFVNRIIRIFFVLVLFSKSIGSIAQTGNLYGIVRDSIGNPISAASIEISNLQVSTTTDSDGNFKFSNLPTGFQSVVVRLIGYEILLRQIEIKTNQTTETNFVLSAGKRMLKEVTVSNISGFSGTGHMNDVHDGVIYSGKKNEVIVLDSLVANTAQNNSRQALGRVPGANYSETEGGGFPSSGIGFRGLNPNQSIEMNTRQNGYNLASDIYGYPESYYLPPLEAVERIEITRGASSLQFGPQFGGVINYILKSGAPDKPFEFTTAQTGGSFGLFNSFNAVGGTYKKWSYYSYIQYKGISGWRPNSQSEQMLGFARMEYNASSRFKIGLEYSILRNTIKMPGGLSDAQFNADPQQSFRSRNWLSSPWNILALKAHYTFSEKTSLSFTSAFNSSERNLVWKNEDGGPQRPDSISPVTNTYVPREVQREGFTSITNELRLISNYNLGGVNQTLAAGVRYFEGIMKRQGGGPGSAGSDFDLTLYGGTYEYDLNFTTTNLAPFVENTFRIGKRMAITPGFRFEYLRSTAQGYITDNSVRVISDRSQTRAIPLSGIGLQYTTSPATNIYANCSQAYRPTDYANQTPVGVSSKIDPNLKDASGFNADLGWRGTLKNYLNFDIGGFYLAYNNRIGLVTLTDAGGNPYTYRTNVANSVHQGVESYVEMNLTKLLFPQAKRVSLSFFDSFAYIDARYVSGEFSGHWVEFAPNSINRFGVTGALKMFSTTFQISNTSKSYADANNTVFSTDPTVGVIPAYQVMDWSGAVRIKNYTIKFGVNNLTDVRYFTLRTDEYPGPGIIPSTGRSIYIGFAAKF